MPGMQQQPIPSLGPGAGGGPVGGVLGPGLGTMGSGYSRAHGELETLKLFKETKQ